MTSQNSPVRALALLGSALLASVASAQTAQVCSTASIPLTTTNWTSSVTIPKFDPALGTLQSIFVELRGTIAGAAKVESLDSSGSVVMLAFQGQITLTRPDLSPLVVTLPVANFTDSLTAFDGTIDFAGTSGKTHPGINTSLTNTVTSPPPAGDLALFTGPIGNPGTIVLPVTAQGTSIATGSGNLISQFNQQASADVRVCYNFLPNTPPTFTCPGLQMASVGVPMSFQICASDTNPNDTVTMTVSGLPAGATLTPVLPASGNPVCTTFNWTPASNQVGNTVVVFTATDSHQRTATCTVTIASAECHMLFAMAGGSSQATIFGHQYDTQLAGLRRFFPVTMEDMPSFPASMLPASFKVQVVMYNPLMFPSNPSQWSLPMTVTKDAAGHVHSSYSGTENGIGIRLREFTQNGQTYVSFPFRVLGM